MFVQYAIQYAIQIGNQKEYMSIRPKPFKPSPLRPDEPGRHVIQALSRVKLLNPDRTKTLQISAKKFDFFACVFETERGVS
jgi:hypothetical protein